MADAPGGPAQNVFEPAVGGAGFGGESDEEDEQHDVDGAAAADSDGQSSVGDSGDDASPTRWTMFFVKQRRHQRLVAMTALGLIVPFVMGIPLEACVVVALLVRQHALKRDMACAAT